MRALAAVLLVASCATPPHSRHAEVTVDDAHARVAAFEASLVTTASTSIVTVDDALEAMKSDRLDRFPAAVAFLEQPARARDIAARGLAAQLQLAWGEGELLVAGLLRTRTAHDDTLDEALRVVAAERVARGHDLAAQLLQDAPDDYVALRVLADVFRLRHQWHEFDDVRAQLEQKKPDSNGLLFLRGIEAAERYGDVDKADAHLRQALTRDPHFVRAQAQRVVLAVNDDTRAAALVDLAALEPLHALVALPATPAP
jgi:tetratricopeptide (TPR) repeat protein